MTVSEQDRSPDIDSILANLATLEAENRRIIELADELDEHLKRIQIEHETALAAARARIVLLESRDCR